MNLHPPKWTTTSTLRVYHSATTAHQSKAVYVAKPRTLGKHQGVCYLLCMEWRIETGLTQYPLALEVMEKRVADILAGDAEELIWLVEHPPLYTGGTSAKPSDLLEQRFPVYETGRGGEYTYHGPGQRVAYLMLDLKKRAETRGRAPDLRAYVKQLEQWIIDTLAELGVPSGIREGRIGVWVEKPIVEQEAQTERLRERQQAVAGGNYKSSEAKIAALGIRVRKWVSFHGIAINVNPDLSHYAGIVPCGISEFGVTSLADIGKQVSMDVLDGALKQTLPSF